MDQLRILIADDHPLVRKGLRAVLSPCPDLEVIAEASTGGEAVTLAAELQPDVVLMDLQMPGGSGIAATQEILATSPHIRILVVTLFEDDDSVLMWGGLAPVSVTWLETGCSEAARVSQQSPGGRVDPIVRHEPECSFLEIGISTDGRHSARVYGKSKSRHR